MPPLRDETRVCSRTHGYTHLDTSSVASAGVVGFIPSTELTSGSSQKGLQAIRLVKSIFRQGANCTVMPSQGGISIVCPEAAQAEILQLCSLAEQRLTRLQQEPLTAKMVEEILSITSAELRRWSKDGRLPTAGRAFFGNGKKQVGLFVYSPDTIRNLAALPDQIASWRRQDQGTPRISQAIPSSVLIRR
jgi:hypothetical protein